jgi:hypothetical protein
VYGRIWLHFNDGTVRITASTQRTEYGQYTEPYCPPWVQTSNARRGDSLDPRLNAMESLSSMIFVSLSNSIN